MNTSGLIEGTPATEGTFAGTVTASNGILPNATQVFSIVIAGPAPVITSVVPPGGTFGTPYNFTYAATGTTPIIYSVTAGALPDGLTLSDSGSLDGTPTSKGTFAGTVTASNGINPSGTQAFNIEIAGEAPVITSNAPPGGSVGTPYTFYYEATGITPISYEVTSGSLPHGLALSASGMIEGTPTAEGTFAGTVMASNGIFPEATQSFSIVIAGATPIITSTTPPGGRVGTSYSHAYAATGTAPIEYSVTSGALPAGLTLGVSGQIDGTPTTSGTFEGTVTASNGIFPDATQTFSIRVESAEARGSGSGAGGGGALEVLSLLVLLLLGLGMRRIAA
jgi:hypothetical protein